MSARRAVLLTLLAVVLVLALAVGGFLGFREYDSVRDRATKAERELSALTARTSGTPDQDSRWEGFNGAFALFVDGFNIYGGEKPKKPEWYAVRVVRNDVDRRICCSIDRRLKLAACRDYHWTPAVPTAIWQSREPSNDASCL